MTVVKGEIILEYKKKKRIFRKNQIIFKKIPLKFIFKKLIISLGMSQKKMLNCKHNR